MESEYTRIGGRMREGTEDEIVLQQAVYTRKGVERILRAAFDYARRQGRSRLCMADKSNVMRFVGDLWQVLRPMPRERIVGRTRAAVVLYSAVGESTRMLISQVVRLGVGLVGMLLFSQVPPHILRLWTPWIYVLGILLLLVPLLKRLMGHAEDIKAQELFAEEAAR